MKFLFTCKSKKAAYKQENNTLTAEEKWQKDAFSQRANK
jgi:hypothetical protein